jgi:surfeit locus 1 family protein
MAGNAGAARGPFPWLAVLLGAFALVILVGLGTWQMQRLHWKEALLATIDQRIHSEPVPVAQLVKVFAKTADVDYWPVTATGVFDHAKEQHFFATHDGAVGYFVYTPLVEERGGTVFVNRGFVPYELKDPATRAEGQIDGPVTVTGLARNPLAEKPSFLVPDNDAAKNVYYWKDLALMASESGVENAALVPFFIDADAKPNPGGLPQGGVTIVSLPNNHLEYAVTWYGLAAALAGVLGVLVWRRAANARSHS